MVSELQQQLAAIFSGTEWPRITDAAQNASEATLTVHLDPEIDWFEGHFPDNPVLPGVVQVHWAVEYARHLFGIDGAFEKVENLKFKSVMLPTMEIELHVRWEAEKQLARFSYSNADAVYSEGRITFS